MESSTAFLNLFDFGDDTENNEISEDNNFLNTPNEILNQIKSTTSETNKESKKMILVPDGEDEFLESDITEENEIILSVYWKRGKLGAAFYTCSDAQVSLLNDITDIHPDFNNLKTFVSQVNPSRVLTYGGSSDAFVRVLSNALNGVADESETDTLEIEEKNIKKIFFMSTRKRDLSYESCKRCIQGLRFGFEPQDLDEEDHIIFVDSHIDLNNEAMVISLGMLIKYLEKYLPEINLKVGSVPILFVNHTSIRDLVSVDEITYSALQIFSPRVHPSAFKRSGSGSMKEGLSLFAILNRCKSQIGVKRMRELFLNPSKNVEELNERLDAVEFCKKPQHQHIVQNLLDCIKKVKNTTGILTNIYRTRASIGNWQSLYSSLYNAILIGEICEKHASHSKLMEKMAKSITSSIHEVAHYMNQVIDFEESVSRNNFTVRSGVDNKLDLLRQTYAQIPDVLVKVAEIELEDLPTFIEECSIIYITELGYLLSVPVWKGDGSDAADYTLPNFDVKFIVNNFVHYKTPRCAELDEVLGDSLASISNIESNIMIALIEFIHARMADIIKALKFIAELDCVIAFAIIASENNYNRPILTTDRRIKISGGRHPLQELCVDNYVPNNTDFGPDKNIVTILTGPNASGKSIYLKQVALIAFMAHIGSFVPAESAQICILDHIHSRIQTIESVSTRMSAFLLDLKQMSHSLYNSTPKTLIVIDEFGKGTTEIDGLSLLAASLIHLIERGDCCPLILVSTHFHSLPKLLPSTNLINLQYMEYVIENDEIVYLYKMKEGVSGSSMTLFAAKLAGIPEDTVKRCREIQLVGNTLMHNANLKITQHMMREISYMEKIFQLASEDENEDNDIYNSSLDDYGTIISESIGDGDHALSWCCESDIKNDRMNENEKIEAIFNANSI